MATVSTAQPWDPLTNPVDRVKFAGMWTPGIARIVGASSPRKWEEIDSSGWVGGLIVYKGIKVCHFNMQLYLYTDEDWQGFNKLLPLLLRPPRGQRPRTFPIWHPQLAQLNINACVVEDVRQSEMSDPTGVWMIDVQLIESRMPKRGKPLAPTGADVQETDPREAEIKRREQLRDALAAEGDALSAQP